MSKAVWVYMTAPNLREARDISKKIVRARLAACVNILGAIQSEYWWKGKICRGREVAIFAKTTRSRLSNLIRLVQKNHSYDCPCIVALPVVGGNPSYLKWIEKNVKQAV